MGDDTLITVLSSRALRVSTEGMSREGVWIGCYILEVCVGRAWDENVMTNNTVISPQGRWTTYFSARETVWDAVGRARLLVPSYILRANVYNTPLDYTRRIYVDLECQHYSSSDMESVYMHHRRHNYISPTQWQYPSHYSISRISLKSPNFLIKVSTRLKLVFSGLLEEQIRAGR
jgi:hypothetical protein